MAAEDLSLHNGRNRQHVEAIGKCLPQLHAVSPLACGVSSSPQQQTFIVKSVNAINAGALVVSTKEVDFCWVFNLVRKKKADRLERLKREHYSQRKP